MGNIESSPKRNSKTSRRSTKLHGSTKSLENQDLDEIYKFVHQMKQTNFGDHLLEEFVLRQSAELECDAQTRDSSSIDTFPIKTIQICEESRSGRDSSKHTKTSR